MKGKLLILGDFNIHVDEATAKSLQLQQIIHNYNLHQHISKPIHARGHTLDLVLSRSNDNIIHNLRLTDPLVSDHTLLLFSLPPSRLPLLSQTVSSGNFKSLGIAAFRNKVANSVSET